MSQTAYTPGIGNAPFGNPQTNPQSSQYASLSQGNVNESILIAKAVREAIFDTAPEQFNALRLVFEKDFIEYNNDEFEYLESTFGRSAVVSTAIVAAVVAISGASVQQTLTVNAASATHITPDVILVYPDNTKAVVKSISGTTVVVESQTDAGLSAVAVDDVFSILSTIAADAQDYFSNYERLETITRYNFIQMFLRASRWGRVELLKYENSGTTNYLVRDKTEKMRQIRTDLFNAFFNGTRGEFSIKNNYLAKSMGGIFPTMVAAGSMNAAPTTASLRTNFETLAFKTNHKKEGATRMIYGTDEMLYELSKVFKDPATRYAPSDKIADLNLDMYKIGTMKFVPVPCELFREQACFPKDWARRLLIIDQESISPVKMKGLPSMNMGSTLDKGTNGTREGFKDWFVEANMSLQFNNPIGSFWLDIK